MHGQYQLAKRLARQGLARQAAVREVRDQGLAANSGQTAEPQFVLSRATRKLLKRLKAVRVKATVTALDQIGNAETTTRTLTLRAPR